MFCPRCSQEQISEETKFCSRCGFSLELVSEFLRNDGFSPELTDTNKTKKWLTRKNGLWFSLFWFMFFALILTPIIGGVAHADALALSCMITGIMGGIVLLIASFAFLKPEPKDTEKFNQELASNNIKNLHQSQQTALPPQHTQPAQNYVSPANSWKAPNTGEMFQPQSVTEVTTRLLKKEK
ncbi:MAG: zinc ribbon domain-containing protein [Acidobacteriota bacterium]|nr:zinc ribbon domain-containing protein [Acidobacteriota bacterium]